MAYRKYSVPKYVQIQDYLRDKIKNGELKPLDRVPSEPELMRQFGVSKNTVTNALNGLAIEGVVYREQGKGTFVSPLHKKQLNLRVGVIEGGEMGNKFWIEFCNTFNEDHPDIHVDLEIMFEHFPMAARDIIDQALAMGNAPDILTIDGPDVPYYAYIKAIRPLDEYITDDEKGKFIPAVIRQGTYKGKLYHLGYRESNMGIIYNKKVFSELKIDPPRSVEEAWTWDGFLEACAKIKGDTELLPLAMWGGRGIASGGEWPTYSGLTFLWQNGADAFSPDGSRTDGYLNSPQAAEAMRWLGELYHRYHFTHFDPIPASFPERAAMSLSMQNDFFYLWEHYPNLEWGLIPLPYNARKASPHGDWGLTITTQSKYPKEAWEFIRNVFTVENQTKLASTVCTPVLRGLYHTIPDFKEEQAFQIVYEQLDKTAMTRPRTPAYPKFSREFTKAYQRVAKGEDAKKALDEAVHEIDEDIRNHGGYEEERFEKALKVAVR